MLFGVETVTAVAGKCAPPAVEPFSETGAARWSRLDEAFEASPANRKVRRVVSPVPEHPIVQPVPVADGNAQRSNSTVEFVLRCFGAQIEQAVKSSEADLV